MMPAADVWRVARLAAVFFRSGHSLIAANNATAWHARGASRFRLRLAVPGEKVNSV
jgi:hypothetical protein